MSASPSGEEPGRAEAASFPKGWARLEVAAFALVASVAVGSYFYRLGEVPPGLFIDETSLGHNARAVLRTGADEHGERWPLFFRGLEAGDHKSPILVYAAAATIGLFGPTPFGLRLAPALFALGEAVALFFLVRQTTGRPRLARWLAVLLLLAPTTLVYGRHAVSEASALGLMLVLGFLALERWAAAPSSLRAALAGTTVALCIYTYSTQRLLAPLMIFGAGSSFLLEKRTRRGLWAFVAGAAIGLAPYAWYALDHPGAMSRRFAALSIWRDAPPWSVVARRFADHYYQHSLSLDFLFRTGDPNLRHGVGVGFLPLWLAAPALLGLAALWQRRGTPMGRFYLLLFPAAAIPAALVHEGWPHATRMLHLVPLVFVAAAVGLGDWIRRSRPSVPLLVVLTALPLLEAAQLLDRYFVDYPAVAQPAFDGGRGEALRIAAAARQPSTEVYVPGSFFGFGETLLRFWMDVDPERARAEGLAGLGIRDLRSTRSYPPGAIVVLPGLATVPGGQPADLIGLSVSIGDRSVLFSVYRIE